MPQHPAIPPERARELARQRAEDLKGFSIHLGVFLIVITGLFLIDIASGSNWWFFYPAIAWGVGLAIHGWVVGVGRVFDEGWVLRKSREWLNEDHQPSPRAPSRSRESHGEVARHSAELIDRMRHAARQIPKPDVRQSALGLCASADQVLSAIEENPNEAALARDFLNRFLTPASTVVTGYARLAGRNVASARPTLEKVESHDLPILANAIDEIYDRLHRGGLIDLEVAREMLSLDIAAWDDHEVAANSTRRQS